MFSLFSPPPSQKCDLTQLSTSCTSLGVFWVTSPPQCQVWALHQLTSSLVSSTWSWQTRGESELLSARFQAFASYLMRERQRGRLHTPRWVQGFGCFHARAREQSEYEFYLKNEHRWLPVVCRGGGNLWGNKQFVWPCLSILQGLMEQMGVNVHERSHWQVVVVSGSFLSEKGLRGCGSAAVSLFELASDRRLRQGRTYKSDSLH